MSILARAISGSGVYHILFRGVNQQNIFEEPADFEKLKETIVVVKHEMSFRVTDSKKKTDEDLIIFLRKDYKIDNPKNISKFSKTDRDKILVELKERFPMRRLQRVLGISRGVITKAQ